MFKRDMLPYRHKHRAISACLLALLVSGATAVIGVFHVALRPHSNLLTSLPIPAPLLVGYGAASVLAMASFKPPGTRWIAAACGLALGACVLAVALNPAWLIMGEAWSPVRSMFMFLRAGLMALMIAAWALAVARRAASIRRSRITAIALSATVPAVLAAASLVALVASQHIGWWVLAVAMMTVAAAVLSVSLGCVLVTTVWPGTRPAVARARWRASDDADVAPAVIEPMPLRRAWQGPLAGAVAASAVAVLVWGWYGPVPTGDDDPLIVSLRAARLASPPSPEDDALVRLSALDRFFTRVPETGLKTAARDDPDEYAAAIREWDRALQCERAAVDPTGGIGESSRWQSRRYQGLIRLAAIRLAAACGQQDEFLAAQQAVMQSVRLINQYATRRQQAAGYWLIVLVTRALAEHLGSARLCSAQRAELERGLSDLAANLRDDDRILYDDMLLQTADVIAADHMRCRAEQWAEHVRERRADPPDSLWEMFDEWQHNGSGRRRRCYVATLMAFERRARPQASLAATGLPVTGWRMDCWRKPQEYAPYPNGMVWQESAHVIATQVEIGRARAVIHLSEFRARYGRWPANMTELAADQWGSPLFPSKSAWWELMTPATGPLHLHLSGDGVTPTRMLPPR